MFKNLLNIKIYQLHVHMIQLSNLGKPFSFMKRHQDKGHVEN